MAKKAFEPSVQDLVYAVDAGLGLKIIRTVLYSMVVTVFMLLYTATQFQGFNTPYAMDAAQLGRNVADSRSFITKCVRPSTIWFHTRNDPAADPRIEAHPDVLHAPMYPLTLAPGFAVARLMGMNIYGEVVEEGRPARIFEPERWLVVGVNNLFTLLAGWVFYLLARQLFNQKVGLLAVSLYFFSDHVWRDSIGGTGIGVASFFVLSTVYTLLKAEKMWLYSEPFRKWFPLLTLSALLCAGAFLTRYLLALLVPGLMTYLFLSGWKKQGGWWPPFYYALVFMIGISPWLIRNWLVCGAPLGMAPYTALEDTTLFSADALARSLEISVSPAAVVEPLKEKWVLMMQQFYTRDLFSTGGGLMTAFFLIGFMHRFTSREVTALRRGLVVSLVLFLLIAPFFGESALRLYHVFWPFMALYGMAFFMVLLDRMQLAFPLLNNLVTGLVVFMTVFPSLLTIMPPRAQGTYPPYYPPFAQHVCRLLNPNEVICTDMPWATAWYGNRISVLLPATVDEFFDINDYKKNIRGLYFTTLSKDRKFASELMGSEKQWMGLMNGQVPQGFPLSVGFPINKQDQFFLTDYVRWRDVETEN